MRSGLQPPANPGNNGTVTIYDEIVGTATAKQPGSTENRRVTVTLYVDQAVTVKHNWSAHGLTTQRVANGSGSGDTITATTLTTKTYTLLPGRNQITITCGATAPTVWEVAVGVEGGHTPAT